MSESMDTWTLRRATNADAAAIRRLVFSVLEEYGLAPDPAATDADLDDIEGHYFRPGATFEVIENGEGEIVGTVALAPLDGRRVELRKMYLAPSARGLGLGKRLLEWMLRKARLEGYDEVWLETNAVLREAVALYEKYGFTKAAREHLSPRCDQAYVLRLTPAGR